MKKIANVEKRIKCLQITGLYCVCLVSEALQVNPDVFRGIHC
jgi:hypothetical protein